MECVWKHQIPSESSILEGLTRTNGKSLNDKALATLMVEVESAVNSRPLTVETLSDISSQMLFSPSNLLTMKTSVIIPPPGVFTKQDLYL